MKKITSLLMMFMLCLGVNAQVKVIKAIGSNITDVSKLVQGGHYIFYNTGRPSFIYENGDHQIMMNDGAIVGAGFEYVWTLSSVAINEDGTAEIRLKSYTDRTFPEIGKAGTFTTGTSEGVFVVKNLKESNTNTDKWILTDKKNSSIRWNGNGKGSNFTGWDDEGSNSQYQIKSVEVEDKPYCSVNHNYAGQTVKSQKILLNYTDDITNLSEFAKSHFSPFNRYGITYNVSATTQTVQNNTVFNIDYIQSTELPFVISSLTNGEFGENMSWYSLRIRNSTKQVAYNGQIDGSENTAKAKDQVGDLENKHYYAFVGNPLTGFMIFNKEVGSNKVIWGTANNNHGAIPTTAVLQVPQQSYWILDYGKDNDDKTEGYAFRINGTDNKYLHDLNYKIGFWDSGSALGDQGSYIEFTPAATDVLVKLEIETAKNEINGYSKLTNIYKSEDITTANSALDAIDFKKPMTEAKQQINNILNQLLSKVDGKSIVLKNNSSLYFATPNGNGGVYGNKTIGTKIVWTFKANTDGTFNVFNAVDNRCLGESGLMVDEANAVPYRFVVKKNETGVNKCALASSKTGKFLRTEGINVGGTLSIDEPEAIWNLMTEKEVLTSDIAKYDFLTGYIGTYTAEQINNFRLKTTISEYVQTLANTQRNMVVEPGCFYQIQVPQSRFATRPFLLTENTDKANTDRAAFGNPNDVAKTIFYYEEETNRLLGYNNGYYIGEANNFIHFAGITSGTDFHFNNIESAEYGAYSIVYKTNTRSLYAQEKDNDKKYFADGANAGQTGIGYRFNVKKVTSLPVTFKGNETSGYYATINAPVALNIPLDVTAYTGKKSTNVVNLTAITTGVIPANSPVLLKATAPGVKNFTIAYDNNDVKLTDNDFVGTIATVAKDGNFLGLGFGAQDKTVVGFYNVNATTLKGFRARLENNLPATVNGLRLNFGETTGIEGVVEELNGKAEIFDLSGRRVVAPKKGLYIVNGKKVYVK